MSDGSTDTRLACFQRLNGAIQAVAAPALGKAARSTLVLARAPVTSSPADARQMFAPDALLALVAPF